MGTCPVIPLTGPTTQTLDGGIRVVRTERDGGTKYVISNYPSGSASSLKREYQLTVPRTYDSTRAYPLVVGYHWLNASANSMTERGDYPLASEQMNFIAIAPESATDLQGLPNFNWPFVQYSANPNDPKVLRELVFFDDLLACTSAQFNIDPRRVSLMGVSAGALWLSAVLSTSRADRIANFLVMSGGLGRDTSFGLWQMNFTPRPNKFPAVVLWGGPTDNLIAVDFDDASKKLKAALIADNHYVISCTHDAGHGEPPVMPPPDGGTKYAGLYGFMLDHPYATAPRASPWQDGGLPSTMPSWCSSATP